MAGIGQLPATLVYSRFGSSLGRGTKLFINGLFILFAAVIITVILKGIYNRRRAKKVSEERDI